MEEHVSSVASEPKGPNLLINVLIIIIGVIGNTAALWILYKSARTRNKKHVLMLRCLATNDLVAQVGMFVVLMLLKFKLIPMYWICVNFVLLRAFGIGSGCVAFVMALERWLALTRPFLYQQIVTYRSLKRFIICFWCGGAILTYFPLIGFGIYYNVDENGNVRCRRYKDAKDPLDYVYAYTFLVFGTGLCICIAICNLTVIWELSRIPSQNRALIRRVSRSIINNNRIVGCTVKYQTPEEVAFAKLMAIICVIFIVCWMPQMISIPMSHFCSHSKFCKIFSMIANVLMCMYFSLDPYVYVLQRYLEKGKIIPRWFSRRSTSSLPTTTTTTAAGTPTSVLIHPPSFTPPALM